MAKRKRALDEAAEFLLVHGVKVDSDERKRDPRGERTVTLEDSDENRVIDAPLPRLLDTTALQALINQIGFSVDERAVLLAYHVNGVPQINLARHLGWPARRASAARRRLARRLARFQTGSELNPEDFYLPGSSTHPAIKERLSNGARVWTLIPLRSGFNAVMFREMVELFEKTSAARNLAAKRRHLSAKTKAA